MLHPSKLPTTALRGGYFLRKCRWGGFSLVELLVSITILTFIMLLVMSMTDQTGKIWKRSTSEIQAFQNARAAYATMTQRLSQATLNTYLDYYDSTKTARTPATAATFVPAYYARNSNLHFIVDQAAGTNMVPGASNLHPGHAVFFQAPLGFTLDATDYSGLPNMLNACGYYVEFNTNKPYMPPFLSGVTSVQERYRYRLMEFLQPTEADSIYNPANYPGTTKALYDKWFTDFLPPNVTVAQAPLRVMADNIIALAILPELSPHDQVTQTNLVTSSYTYDSRAGDIITNKLTHHQLPPLLRVVMVAIDEPSAEHLNPVGSTTPPSLISGLTFFQTTTSPDPNTDINNDLATLTAALSAKKVNYRVFDNDIAIRGAKWSTVQ